MIIGLVLRMGFFGIVKLVLWVVLIDCILVGLFISTIYWYVANRYLIANPKSNLDVEWAYCFDVHLNAVLPLLTILHIGQLPFLNGTISKIQEFFFKIKFVFLFSIRWNNEFSLLFRWEYCLGDCSWLLYLHPLSWL